MAELQEVLSISNDVAAELAGVGDGVLGALRERLDCTIRLRGNQLTLEGDDSCVAEARAVVDELVELVEGGHEIGPNTVDAVLGALDQAEDIRDVFDDVVWRHRGTKIAPKTVNQKRYVDAIREHTITFGIGPAGTGKTYLAMALAVAALTRAPGRPHHPHAPRGRGRRAARLPPRRPAREGGPVPAPALRRALRHAGRRARERLMEKGAIEVAPLAYMRGRTLNDSLHHPRRGAEHEPRADEDVPDAPRLRLEDGRHRRHHPDRPAAEPGVGADLRPDVLGSIDGIAFVEFANADVVRHKLVQRIVEAYRTHAEATGQSQRNAAEPRKVDDRGREPQRRSRSRRRRARRTPVACSRPRGSRTASSDRVCRPGTKAAR